MVEVHPTAIVGARVKLASGVRIGPGAIIEDDVLIGERTEIGAYAYVGRLSEIGAENRIGMMAQIGGDPQIASWQPADSKVVIGVGNTIREFVTVHRAKAAGEATVIGDHCYLMTTSHVAHDCRLGNRVVLVNGALLAGHVEVGDDAFISGNCVVHQFVRIGRRVMVRGMTALGKDVVPFVLVDQSNSVRSLNKVGLRRAGFSREVVGQLEHAFRQIFRSKRPLSEAIELLEREPMGEEVRELVDFIKASKRGICLTYSSQVHRLESQAASEPD